MVYLSKNVRKAANEFSRKSCQAWRNFTPDKIWGEYGKSFQELDPIRHGALILEEIAAVFILVGCHEGVDGLGTLADFITA